MCIYMPYRKHYPQRRYRKRNPRKRINKRKYKYGKSKAIMTRMRSVGFADVIKCRLKYSDHIVMSAVTTNKTYVFRGNSLFDPDYTSTGHQPLYFDQYSAVYNKYKVYGSAVTIRFTNFSTTSALYLVLEPNTDLLATSSTSTIIEQSRSKLSAIVSPNQLFTRTLKSYCSTRKACGLTKFQLSDEDYGALITANPNQIWYWNIFCSSVDASSVVNAAMEVTITYYCEFFDRGQQGPS